MERPQYHPCGIWNYFSLRARFAFMASKDIVTRHWQWFLLAGLFVPGLPIVSIFLMPAHLFGLTLSPSLDFPRHLALLALLQAGAVAWLLPQRRFLHGGNFREFVAILPISLLVRCVVSAMLLCVVDVLPFAPVAIGVALHMEGPHSAPARDLAEVLAFLLDILCLQVGILERLALLPIGALLADLPLAAASASGSEAVTASWLLAVVGILLLSLRLAERFDRVGRVSPFGRRTQLRIGRLRWAPEISPVLRVQFKALAERPFITGSSCLLAIAIPVGTCALAGAFCYDARSPTAIIIGMAVVSLVISRLSEVLRNAHMEARMMLTPLPIPKLFWPARDVILVAMLGMMPLPVFLLPLVSHRLVSLIALGGLCLSYLALIGMLRAVLGIGMRFRLVASVAIAMAWAGSAIAGVAR